MLPRTLLRTGLRDLLRRPLHTGLMVLGVALGVAVVIAIDLANESARRGFARSTETLVGRATHRVLGGPTGIEEDLYRRLRVEWGLRRSAPVVEGVVVAPGLDAQPLRVLGVDPLAEEPFRDHVALDTLGAPGFSRFFTNPLAVLMGAPMAERHRLTIGSGLPVRIDDREVALELLGLIRPGDSGDASVLDGLLIMDVGSAQKLLGREGRLSHIDLILDAAEARDLAARLPSGTRLVPASEHAGARGQLTDAFQLNLTALSLLALVVGMFLIYNTVMFSVVQRRAVIGTLRALGVTGTQVFWLILAETAAASALGTGLGLGLGWLLGQGAVRLVTQTINDLYYVLAVVGAPLTPSSLAKGVALGIGAGVLAAVAPALEAARVQPITALRPSTLETASRSLVPWVAAGGLGLAACGAALLRLATGSLEASFAGLFGIVLGLALVTPLATIGLMRVAGPAAAGVLGTLGRLAARTVTRSIARTGVAIAALMVAVSVTIGVGLMIGSFRSTVANWLDLTLVADVYVSSPSASRRASPTLSPDVPERVAAVPGVAFVETFRSVRLASNFGEIQLRAMSLRQGRSAGLYRFATGDPAGVWEEVREGAVVVSEPFAYRHGIPPRNGRLTIETDQGPHTFEIAGICYDYSTEEGIVLMSREVYDRFFADPGVSSVAVYLADGYALDDVVAGLRAALRDRLLRVAPNRGLRARALEVFDRTFAVTNALRLLAVVVAFIGVWSALMALQVERTRELATLRALGLTPGRLWGLTLLESGLMGGAAGLLSWPTGTLLAVILTEVINVRSFGWTMRMELDPWLLAQALALSVLASLLAAVYPLLRLQRMPVSAALRQE